ncbi:MAG: FkbM family methyltransferase [Acidobacteria bacterium]|nr:FkbM family methyltransferase [Acidobacteriota bacterium]
MTRTLKIVLPAVALVLAAATVAHFYAPARLLAIKAAGRAPQCPLANALQAHHNEVLQVRYKDEILAASRLLQKVPGFHFWETPMGRWWIPEGDDWMLPFNLAEQKRRIYGTGARAVQPGDIVLDCGANIGVYTRLALDSGAKTVVAIEPAPENVESLNRNFAAEIAAGRVIVVPKGVWDKDDFLTLKIDPSNTAADTFVMNLKDGRGGIRVPLTTIDKLAAELKLARVDYIKMDIEGAEQRALAGARETLARFHPRLALSAYHVPDDPVRIPALVREAWPGYRMECGPCAETRDRRVRPDVLNFW